MAGEEDVLLDTFVRILPHADNEKVLRDAIEKTKAMFGEVDRAALNAGRIGGSAPTENLAARFERAKREAQELARQAAIISRTVKSLGDENIAAGFRNAVDGIKKAQQDLRNAAKDSDQFGLSQVISQLRAIEDRFQGIRARGIRDIIPRDAVRQQFDSIVESERQNRPNFAIDYNLRASLSKNIGPQAKEDIARLNSEVQKTQVLFNSLVRTFNGSAEALENITAQATRLTFLRDAISETQQQAAAGSRSFNSLSNNAYQLGQAFEDASVGFQLNGITGAVRGAANNISFIINDLSRMPSIEKKFPNLGLIAGIGSGLAILILPRMVEWLQSLNDIEAGFKDITQEIQNAAEARDLSIKLDADNTGLAKTVRDAEDLKTILEQIRTLSEEQTARQAESKGIFAGFDVKELGLDDLTPIQNINDQFERLTRAIQHSGEEAVALDAKIKAIRGLQPINQIFGETFTEDIATAAGIETPEVAIARLRNFRQEVFSVQRAINDAIEQGKAGVTNPEIFIRAQRQLDEFKKNLTTNIGRLELSEAERATAIATFEGITDAVAKDLERAEVLAVQSAKNIGDQFEIAFEGARNKVAELQNQLKLGEQISQGKNTEFDAELLTLNEQISKGRLLLLESIDALRKEAERSKIAINEEGLKAIQDSFELESQVNLKRLLQEEKILEAKKKGAQFTSLEEFSKRLQINALGGKEEEDRRGNIARLEQAIGRNAGQNPFADVAMQSRIPPTPQEQAQAFEQALRVLMPPLFQLVESQNGTTEAVKKVNTGAQ